MNVERLARALMKADGVSDDWPEWDREWPMYLDKSRRVVAALAAAPVAEGPKNALAAALVASGRAQSMWGGGHDANAIIAALNTVGWRLVQLREGGAETPTTAGEDACLSCDNGPERHCYRCGACPTGLAALDKPALGIAIHRLPENHPARCFCGDPLRCSTVTLIAAAYGKEPQP